MADGIDRNNPDARRTNRTTRGGDSGGVRRTPRNDVPQDRGRRVDSENVSRRPQETDLPKSSTEDAGLTGLGGTSSNGETGAQSDGINAAAGAAGRAAGAKQARKSGNRGAQKASRPGDSEGGSPQRRQGQSTDAARRTPKSPEQKPADTAPPDTGVKKQPAALGAGSAGSFDAGKDADAAKRDTPDGESKSPVDADGHADPAADPKSGLTGGLDGIGADATGVDYSDKGLKDRLEHQAADVAMDATPYLAQFNSARKALKNYNKEKNAAGGDDDQLSDKVEDATDKVVDGGINTAKATGAAAGAGGLGIGGMMGLMMVKTLLFFKGLGSMALGLLGSIGSAIAGAFTAATSFVAGMLGVGTAVAASFIGTMTAGAVLTSAIFGTFLLGPPRDAGNATNACTPDTAIVSEAVSDRVESDGQGDAQREENAKKLWSVYSELGGTKAQTSAVLGNLHHESAGLDPTAVETILGEPFMNGPQKQAAEAADFKIAAVNPSYSARFPAITYMGIGLAQWTNGRNLLLQEFSKAQDMPWHQFDTQMMFMLEGDEEYRQTQLLDFIKSGGSNVDSATGDFMTGWIGLPSGHASLSARQGHAQDYAFMLERATADKNYAEGILAGVNIDKSEGNNAAGAFHQDDGCGDTVKSHYGSAVADGTGAVPTDLTLTPWKKDDLPESLQQYAVDPEDTGISWGNADGWAPQIYPDQCVALSDSYMINLYPEWNKGGRSTAKPRGNGHATAGSWAAHFGETTSPVPQKGAVFSSNVFPPYGHTGIVQHVFENGDILVVEQNIRGYSGQLAPGMSYSWSWQVIRKGTYESEGWEFFKPSEFEPQWYKDGSGEDA